MTMAFPPNMQQLLDDARSLSQLVAMQDKLTVDSTWELHQTADHQWYAARKVLGSSRLHILSLRPTVLKALEDVRDWNKVQRVNTESLLRVPGDYPLTADDKGTKVFGMDFDYGKEQRAMQEELERAQQTQTLSKGCATPPVTEQEEQPYHHEVFEAQTKLAEQRVAEAEQVHTEGTPYPNPLVTFPTTEARLAHLYDSAGKRIPDAPSHTEPKTTDPRKTPVEYESGPERSACDDVDLG